MQVTSSSRSGRSTSAGVAIAGLLGGLCGALLTVWLRSPAASNASNALPSPAREAESEAASFALAAIGTELRAIRLLLEEPRLAPASQTIARVPADAPAATERSSAPDLEAMLADVIRALQRTATNHSPGPGLVFSQSPPRGRLPDPEASAFEGQLRAHLLLSRQQVLDEYGRPDTVTPTPLGFDWYYSLEGGKKLRICFKEGLVFDSSAY